jgi:hypothetical protein
MPYLSPDERVGVVRPLTAGQLNYCLTQHVLRYLEAQAPDGQPKYLNYNAAIGALECAKLELYRRMVAPYEDRKCKENGDVFPVVGSSSPGCPE